MPIEVLMPALSPTMEKGKLAKWVKEEGDKVKSGDVIAEIETDKATMEVEAVDEGTLGKILVPEGTEDVAVNTPIARDPGRRRGRLGRQGRSRRAASPRSAAATAEPTPNSRRPKPQAPAARASPPPVPAAATVPEIRTSPPAPRW